MTCDSSQMILGGCFVNSSANFTFDIYKFRNRSCPNPASTQFLFNYSNRNAIISSCCFWIWIWDGFVINDQPSGKIKLTVNHFYVVHLERMLLKSSISCLIDTISHVDQYFGDNYKTKMCMTKIISLFGIFCQWTSVGKLKTSERLSCASSAVRYLLLIRFVFCANLKNIKDAIGEDSVDFIGFLSETFSSGQCSEWPDSFCAILLEETFKGFR